jgi:hypothetical protein
MVDGENSQPNHSKQAKLPKSTTLQAIYLKIRQPSTTTKEISTAADDEPTVPLSLLLTATETRSSRS